MKNRDKTCNEEETMYLYIYIYMLYNIQYPECPQGIKNGIRIRFSAQHRVRSWEKVPF